MCACVKSTNSLICGYMVRVAIDLIYVGCRVPYPPRIGLYVTLRVNDGPRESNQGSTRTLYVTDRAILGV